MESEKREKRERDVEREGGKEEKEKREKVRKDYAVCWNIVSIWRRFIWIRKYEGFILSSRKYICTNIFFLIHTLAYIIFVKHE